MKQDTLRISEMTTGEIIEVAQVCSAMFTSANLTDASAAAYVNILKYNFSGMKGQEIINLCSKAAANPPKTDFRFSPSFLSIILRGYEKINQTSNTEERILSQAEKDKSRHEFLKDLYSDFDTFKNGGKPHRIKVWQYVAELMVRKGISERMPVISEQRQTSQLKDMLNEYQPFVHDCFKKIISEGRHINQIVNGVEN